MCATYATDMLNFSKLGKEDASLCKWHLLNNEHALKAMNLLSQFSTLPQN